MASHSGATEIAGLDKNENARVDIARLDIVGPVWQGWTLQDWTTMDD